MFQPVFRVDDGVDEGVVAGGAHGHQVAAHLQEVDVALPRYVEVGVQVQQQVQHLGRERGSPLTFRAPPTLSPLVRRKGNNNIALPVQ